MTRAHVNRFFPERGETLSETRQICAACPVWDRCLIQGLGGDELVTATNMGMYGGTTSRLRRIIRSGAPTVIAALGVMVAWDGEKLDVVGVQDELDIQRRRPNSTVHAAQGSIPPTPPRPASSPLSVVPASPAAPTPTKRREPPSDPLPLVASGA